MQFFRCWIYGLVALGLQLETISAADDLSTNVRWRHHPAAQISGQRTDIPLGYSPVLKQFLVLGGRTHYGEYRRPRPYDVLALNPSKHQWENHFPEGRSWGPVTGNCQAPAWKDERFGFLDTEGNRRPNWTIYGTFSIGRKFDYDPIRARFYFYAGGHTFSYNPVSREWIDHAPESHPEKQLGGILLWSSMCYEPVNDRFILFGGGNVTSDRGDPGTWAYYPGTNKWQLLTLEVLPPARANSQLAYDPSCKRIIMFGGDTLSSLLNDTWAFDVTQETWKLQQPQLSPSPRAGHALHWSKSLERLVLVGGYTYTSTTEYVASLYQPLPLEIWTYDAELQLWGCVDRDATKQGPVPSSNRPISSAINEDGTLTVLDRRNETWTCQLNAAASDGEKTKRFGVAPGTEVHREKSHDPKWYQENVPPADPVAVQRELQAIPANQWVLRPTPKRPEMNLDWGSAVLSPDLGLIMRFSGGHSAYSGTAPQIYDINTDRYSLPFEPEYPIEFVYTNDQVDGEWSFRGNPWMTGHTYKSTAYDPHLKCLVFVPHAYAYFFDPARGKWSRSPQRNPFRPDFYTNTVCTTPAGAVVWAKRGDGRDGLWRLDSTTRCWSEMALTEALPETSADESGMAYDSKRNRLLCFSGIGKDPGNVLEYDISSKSTKWLEPTAKRFGAVHSRETAYIPEWDIVMLAARTRQNGAWRWLAYDCAANRWIGLNLAGEDPIGKGTSRGEFHNSVGLMYDPDRKLVWTVGQHSQVHVLKLLRTEQSFEELDLKSKPRQ